MRVKSLIEQRLKQLELKGYTLENYFNIIHSDKNALFSEYKNNKVDLIMVMTERDIHLMTPFGFV